MNLKCSVKENLKFKEKLNKNMNHNCKIRKIVPKLKNNLEIIANYCKI